MTGTLTNFVELVWHLTREHPILRGAHVLGQEGELLARFNSESSVMLHLVCHETDRVAAAIQTGERVGHFGTTDRLDTAAQADGIATVFAAMDGISSSCRDSLSVLARVLPTRIKSWIKTSLLRRIGDRRRYAFQ